jgi:hypothetical protein
MLLLENLRCSEEEELDISSWLLTVRDRSGDAKSAESSIVVAADGIFRGVSESVFNAALEVVFTRMSVSATAVSSMLRLA